MAVAAGFAIIKTLMEKENKIFFATSSLIIIFALVLSQTRGAILGLMTILFVCLILIKHKRKNIVLFLLAFLAFNAVFLTFNSYVRTRLFSIPKGMIRIATGNLFEKIESTSMIDGSAQIRLIMWKTGIKIIKDYPVFGVGPRGLEKIVDKYCPYLPQVEKAWSNLHNLYLHQAAERGLFGLFALLFLLFSILYKGIVFLKKTNGMFSLAAVSTMCGFLVMNLTETSFQHAVISMAVFFIFSLGFREVFNHDNLNSEHRS